MLLSLLAAPRNPAPGAARPKQGPPSAVETESPRPTRACNDSCTGFTIISTTYVSTTQSVFFNLCFNLCFNNDDVLKPMLQPMLQPMFQHII